MSTYKFGDDYPDGQIEFGGFDQYQDFCATTDKAGTDLNCMLGLMGELGEIAEKTKKLTRKSNPEWPCGNATLDFHGDDFTETDRRELAKEVGDVLWYASRLADRLGYSLGTIVSMNVAKLTSRKTRGLLHGKGDNR